MENLVQYRYALVSEQDISNLTQEVRQICLNIGFDRIDTEELVLACSEIGHNAVRHGGGGDAVVTCKKYGKVIKITITDNGKGIPNIELARRDGYSTVKTSLGLGLESVHRLADNVKIKSSPEIGTSISFDKSQHLDADTVEYGLVSIPDSQQNYNGDQYILKEYDGDSVLVGVIDGPGQGYHAHAIAQSCKQFVEANYRRPIPELIAALNVLVKETNDDDGFTCALARISPGELRYQGLGDTHAYVIPTEGEIKTLENQSGRGGHMLQVNDTCYYQPFTESIRIILCTDGLNAISDVPNMSESIQHQANEIFDRYQTNSDDATVMLVHYKRVEV